MTYTTTNEKATIEVVANDAKAEIMGNENLEVGHNEIIVKVTAEKGKNKIIP